MSHEIPTGGPNQDSTQIAANLGIDFDTLSELSEEELDGLSRHLIDELLALKEEKPGGYTREDYEDPTSKYRMLDGALLKAAYTLAVSKGVINPREDIPKEEGVELNRAIRLDEDEIERLQYSTDIPFWELVNGYRRPYHPAPRVQKQPGKMGKKEDHYLPPGTPIVTSDGRLTPVIGYDPVSGRPLVRHNGEVLHAFGSL